MGKPAPLGVSASGLPPEGDLANAVVEGTLSAVGPGKPFAFLGPFNLSIYGSYNTELTTTHGSDTFSVDDGSPLAIGTSVDSPNVPRGTTIKTVAGDGGTFSFPPVTLYGNINKEAAKITNLPATEGLVGSTVSGQDIPDGTTVLSILIEADPSRGIKGSVKLSNAPTETPALNNQIPFEFSLTNDAVLSGTDNDAIFTGFDINYIGIVSLERSFDGGRTWLTVSRDKSGAAAVYSSQRVSAIFDEPERQVLYRLNCTEITGLINYRMSASGAAAQSLSIASSI